MKQFNPNASCLLLDINGVVELTGLSERSVLLLCQHGFFPRSVQPMGFVLWRRLEIVKWVEDGCGRCWDGITDAEIRAKCEEAELRYAIENPDEYGPAEASGFDRDRVVTTTEAYFIENEGDE